MNTDTTTPSAPDNTGNPFPTPDEIYAHGLEYTGNLILNSQQRTQRHWGFTEGSDYAIKKIEPAYSQLKADNEAKEKRIQELEAVLNIVAKEFEQWPCKPSTQRIVEAVINKAT